MEWKDISTAPRDGTAILISDNSNPNWQILIASWGYGSWNVHGNEIYGEMCGINPVPTHWIPLPPPPKDE